MKGMDKGSVSTIGAPRRAAVRLHDGAEWAACGWCGKRQFPITPGAVISGQLFRCKNSKCGREFEVEYPTD